MSHRPRLVAILGPTAVGKSTLGIALAQRFGGEIVSCDSTAVYRGFDIGTDKVPFEQRGGILHHLIDVAGPMEEYSAARYAREAAAAFATSRREAGCRFSSGGRACTTVRSREASFLAPDATRRCARG